jgi:putative tryptophan/tyrosine transport system substrate-binding protein
MERFMRRRDFITLAGGGAAAWPLLARAQQGISIPVIGYLGSASRASSDNQLAGFHRGLEEESFVESRDATIEYRWSDGQYEQLSPMATDLVARKVLVILASGLPAALAAKAATSTIPIIFVMGADPVTSGIVPSLVRPSGNITGVSQYYGALGGKRLEMLREIVPTAAIIAVLTDPNNPNYESHLSDVQSVARATGQKIVVAAVRNEAEVDAAFARFSSEHADALLVADDPFFTVNRKRIIALAAQARLPAIYYTREYTIDGGLMSYGSSTYENYRLAGDYVARVIKGATPPDLPVLQPTKFELVINRNTAKALGLTLPQTFQATADEVIE